MNNITKLGAIVAEAVEQTLNEIEDELTLTAIEQTTRALLQTIGQTVVKQIVEKAAKPNGAEIACECGANSVYVRRRPARLFTLFGRVIVKRSYYLCDGCHQGQCPADKALGLRPNQLSAEVARLAALVGVQLPFQTGCDLFKQLTLVDISDQAMGKATRRVGHLVAKQEADAFALTENNDEMLRRQREEVAPLRRYGSLDATKVHIRGENDPCWRDLKVGAWYEASGQPPKSPDDQWRIVAKNISYFTDISHASAFGDLFWSTGVQRQADLAHELILIGDGAEWIWNLASHHFPDAVQILDWFHASEHLAPVAQAFFQDELDQKRWIQNMRDFLWNGQCANVVSECRRLYATSQHDVIRITANYFDSHQRRMRYDFFRSQGYQIGSGTIESAAKQIGMMRMKVPGAIWNLDHARAVAKARASYLSYQWADLPLAT